PAAPAQALIGGRARAARPQARSSWNDWYSPPRPDDIKPQVVRGRSAGRGRRRIGGWLVATRRFQLVLLKPSHYHDDGYVIRWWRALIPSNSLASVYGLALDCAQRGVLGSDVAIDIDLIDETNTRVNIPKLLRRFRKHGNFGLLALVGVQSNQYPRALDIARPFRTAGIPTAIGGVHLSRCLAMLRRPRIRPLLARALGLPHLPRATRRRA